MAGNYLEKRSSSSKDGAVQTIKLENINCAKYFLKSLKRIMSFCKLLYLYILFLNSLFYKLGFWGFRG